MERYFVLMLSLFFTVSTSFCETHSSSIKEVIVYQQGAKITRQAAVSIPAGKSEVTFNDLSPNLNQSSVQASVKGAAIILSVNAKTNYMQIRSSSKKVKVLEDSVKLIDHEMKWLKKELEVYNEELKILETNRSIVIGKGKVSAVELKNWVDYYGQKQKDIRRNIHKLEIKNKDLRDLYNRLTAQLNQERGRVQKHTGEITLVTMADKAVNATIDISYVVNNAGWAPIYDIRSEEGNDKINLMYKANVYQRSGYDWNDVKLTVSTGNPLISNDRPILNPWYIDFMPNNQVYNRGMTKPSMRMSTSNMIYEELDESMAGLEIEKAPAYQVTQSNNALHASYTIEHDNDIPSDGKEHLVILKEYDIGARFKYHAVPKLNEAAFLVARIGGYGQYNLLPGDANIFFNNGYVGNTFLNPDVATDSLVLSFGRSNNIQIDRTILKDVSGKKLLGANNLETKGFEFKIVNNSPSAIELEILDQLPVSKNEDIKVELIESPEASFTEKTGRLFWDIELTPKEVKKLKFIYTVKYPKDRSVTGF
ncbi:MAG: mucoidy inhibitor MuiA family protein [Bacteroidales bacterium]|nr:mucoidy inhibitor MuiA family protein [Bacteroidales bacterium]